MVSVYIYVCVLSIHVYMKEIHILVVFIELKFSFSPSFVVDSEFCIISGKAFHILKLL